MSKILLKYNNNLLKRTGNILTGYEGTPITNFNASGSSASQIAITVGDSLNFYDTSIKNPTSWNWNFGNGSPSTSTVQNPTGITFGTTGLTTISLITSNNFGTNTLTKTDYINVNPVYGKKLVISINAHPPDGLSIIPYYTGLTWTPSGLTQRSWTWNMWCSDVLAGVPTIACTMALKYTDNTLSNYRANFTIPLFDGEYDNGKVTGNNTGIYPDSVIQYSLVNYSWTPKVTEHIRLSGLTTSTTYKVTLLGNRGGWNATTRYTITGGTSKDGTYVTLNTNDNTMNTVSISNITPSALGIIDIGVDYDVTSANNTGFINAIEIDEGG